jgi:pSer/pThr/pTyr-binding forkhead associated (FHA) protein
MAELVASNGARFPLSREASLVGRHDEDGASSDPDVDLGALEGGRTVSRQHVRIYRSDGDWYLKVHSGARNATVVAGQLLLPGQQTTLHDGDEITLGTVSVTFRVDHELPAADPNATMIRTGPAAAELRSGDLRVPLAVVEGQMLTLGRHSSEQDDQKYRPDVDLGAVPSGRTISRRHGLVYHRGNTWYLRVEAEVTNPTYLNAKQLQKGEEVALTDGDTLRMGNAVATFHQDKPVRYVDSDLLDLVLGPPTEVALEAGAQQALGLTLVNFTGRVDWFIVDVGRISREWWKVVLADGTTSTADQLPQVRLDTAVPPVPTPTATARVTLVLAPPRRPDARAGIYPFVVSATSLDNRRLRRTATGQLVVKPFTSLRLSLEPAYLTGSRGRFRLGVFNDGNAPTSVAIHVDADNTLEATLEHSEVPLANGGETAVDLSLRVKRRPWLGPEVVHKATIKAVADEQTHVQQAMLTCPPRIPLWVQNLVGRIQADVKPILAVLAVLAALLVAGYLWLLPPDIKLVPDKPLVASGDSTTLSWNVRRAEGDGVLEGPAGSQQVALPRGKITVNPDQAVEYTLTAKNLIGLGATGSARIQVLRVVSFTATPDTLKQPGDPVTLQWTTENATRVSIDPPDEIASPPLNGKVVVHPQATTTYRLVASNDPAAAQVSAETRAAFGAPRIAQFQQDHQQVFPGDPVLLSWVADGFTRLTLKGSSDDLELKGVEQDVTRRTSIQVRPVHSGQYTLVAANTDGTTTEAQVSVGTLPIKLPRLQPPAKPISAGDTATLSWQIEGANDRTIVVLQPDGTDVSGRTSIDVQPDQTTRYTLQVTGADGQTITSDPVTVSVLPAIQEFRVVPATVTEGDPVVLTWNVVDADTVTITRDDGARFVGKPSDETRDHPPASVTSYTLKARNATGESVDSAVSVIKIKVQPPPTPTPAPAILPLPDV